MATDIIARGMAANAKKSVTELGDKVESEKWIGTKAEWEAVDKSTIKDGTIVYITDDETVILYDKAEMEKIAAQVAADRKAAETAAQTAQAVADSLSEDYVTAVGKIAENTAEIANVKLTDKELQRRVDALYFIGQGITHRFETDSETAYQKAVPTGAKLMSVKSIGGRSIVFNQMIPDSIIHVTVTIDEDIAEEKWLKQIVTDTSPIAQAIGHKVVGKCIRDINNPSSYVTVRFGNNNVNVSNGSERYTTTENGIYTLSSGVGNPPPLYFRAFAGATAGTYKFTLQLFDLTAMFGAGNEPTSVEEFEKMFPNDYYPYNAGEIVSAGTTEIVEQGKNLFDLEKCVELGLYYGFEIDTNKTLQIALKGGKTCPTNVSFGIAYIRGNTMANWLVTSQGVVETKTDSSKMTDSTQIMVVCYPGNKETMQSIADAFDIMLVDGIYKSDTMPAYAPFHRNEYPIPEAIKALPGYGWSAGTAKNYVDYENKRYVQCVGAVDLGTLTWTYGNLPFGWGDNQWFSAPIQSIKIIPTNTQLANVLCKKYTTRYAYVADGNDFFRVDKSIGQHQGVARVTVLDTAYTDATAFKQAMQGVMLYYELETPIITDISSLIPDDFLRNIEVEAGGSVTFKNSNDNYHIPVPSEEEYIVKLSEIGGNV